VPGFESQLGQDSSLPDSVQTASGAPPIQCVPAAISLEVNRPGREDDHSPPSSAEVKNGGAIPPLPHMCSRHGA
jgi:hypothetical protein